MDSTGEESDIVEITWKLPHYFGTEMLKMSREICLVNDVSRYGDYYEIIFSCVNPITCYIPII